MWMENIITTHITPCRCILPIPTRYARDQPSLIKHEVEKNGKSAYGTPQWIVVWQNKAVLWLCFLVTTGMWDVNRRRRHGLPQAELFWSHETFLKHRILLVSMVIPDHYDWCSAGGEHQMVECMTWATRWPCHFDSVLSIATSTQNVLW